VAEWTRSDIDEVYQLRSLLESRAAGLAAERHSEEKRPGPGGPDREMGQLVQERRSGYRDELDAQQSGIPFAYSGIGAVARLFSIGRALADSSVTLGTWYHYNNDDMPAALNHHREIVTL